MNRREFLKSSGAVGVVVPFFPSSAVADDEFGSTLAPKFSKKKMDGFTRYEVKWMNANGERFGLGYHVATRDPRAVPKQPKI